MSIATNNPITWGELIDTAKANLLRSIENLEGATIPAEFTSQDLIISRITSPSFATHAKTNKVWTTVSRATVESDFDAFLTAKDLNSTSRHDNLVTTRLILNFFENVSLYYQNRLIIVYSPFNNVRKLYYYNNGSTWDSWAGAVSNIPNPESENPISNVEINTLLASVDANLKNKIKTYEQTYTFWCTSSSSSSSCSSSSSSSSSCWTILHQDLSML